MKKVKEKAVQIAVCILALIILGACSSATSTAQGQVNFRRNAEGDVCLSESAGHCIEAFLKDYPKMKITKVRWQKVDPEIETYVVEGNDGKTKSIVKYLDSNLMVLGRVDREFKEWELLENGNCKEKALEFPSLLTMTELREIAIEELGGDLHEFMVSQSGEFVVAYVETRYKNVGVRGIYINAKTGEIL